MALWGNIASSASEKVMMSAFCALIHMQVDEAELFMGNHYIFYKH